MIFFGNVSLHGEGSAVAMCWGVESRSGSGRRCLWKLLKCGRMQRVGRRGRRRDLASLKKKKINGWWRGGRGGVVVALARLRGEQRDFGYFFFFFLASLLAAKKELLPLWLMLLNCPGEVCGRLLARCTGLSISLPCMCVTFTPLHTWKIAAWRMQKLQCESEFWIVFFVSCFWGIWQKSCKTCSALCARGFLAPSLRISFFFF